MSYSLIYHPEVRRDIARLPQNINDRIRKAIEERVLLDPAQYGDPLRRSLKGYRKLRVGDYRVIYRVEKNHVIVLKIGHRKEVYSNVFLRLK